MADIPVLACPHCGTENVEFSAEIEVLDGYSIDLDEYNDVVDIDIMCLACGRIVLAERFEQPFASHMEWPAWVARGTISEPMLVTTNRYHICPDGADVVLQEMVGNKLMDVAVLRAAQQHLQPTA